VHHFELVDHAPCAGNLAALAQYPEELPGISYDSLEPHDAIPGRDSDVLGADPRVIR